MRSIHTIPICPYYKENKRFTVLKLPRKGAISRFIHGLDFTRLKPPGSATPPAAGFSGTGALSGSTSGQAGSLGVASCQPPPRPAAVAGGSWFLYDNLLRPHGVGTFNIFSRVTVVRAHFPTELRPASVKEQETPFGRGQRACLLSKCSHPGRERSPREISPQFSIDQLFPPTAPLQSPEDMK